MCAKRVFKTKTFGRWSKKIVDDRVLCTAAREIENGYFEANLGAGVFKKRVPLPGQGKSGAVRTLVAGKSRNALIFMAGREQNQPRADFSASEEEAAKVLAKARARADDEKLDQLILAGALLEICNES